MTIFKKKINKKKFPLVTVDCVLFKFNSVLLIKRKFSPFKNFFALPGGFVDVGETVEEACVREMKEETSINLKVNDLKLVGIYSNPRRDPRRSTISISFYSEINKIISPKAGDDAIFAEFKENWQKEKLAFDHKIIIKDSISKFRSDVKK